MRNQNPVRMTDLRIYSTAHIFFFFASIKAVGLATDAGMLGDNRDAGMLG